MTSLKQTLAETRFQNQSCVDWKKSVTNILSSTNRLRELSQLHTMPRFRDAVDGVATGCLVSSISFWIQRRLRMWFWKKTVSALFSYLGMDQYLLIPFLVGWTSIYQLFWGCFNSFQSQLRKHGLIPQKILARSAGLVANEDESFKAADGRVHKRVCLCIYIYIT